MNFNELNQQAKRTSPISSTLSLITKSFQINKTSTLSYYLLNDYYSSTEPINAGLDGRSDVEIGSDVDSKLNKIEEKIIIFVFLAVIILGFFGNFLVIWTVALNKHMRTSNNLFILNLAISDLTLCVFSIPFNVYKTLRHTWIFGEFLCKFAPFFQATNVFVSTMSITAIALDRYVNIVCAMKIRQSNSFVNSYGPIAILVFIWVFAFMLSSPLFLFNILQSISIDIEKDTLLEISDNHNNNVTEILFDLKNDHMLGANEEKLNHISINHCIENSPFHQSRLIYSYASLIIQYTLPILIVGLAYGSIWWKLKSQRNKLRNHQSKQSLKKRIKINENNGDTKRNDQKSESNNLAVNKNVIVANNNSSNHSLTTPNGGTPGENNNNNNATDTTKKSTVKSLESKRRLKMNILLAFIAIIFAASWLPLNLFNLLSDSKLSIIKANHSYYMVNAICILLGMSSAVSNPFLYGFLNENFKREYVKLFSQFTNRILICFNKKTETNSDMKELKTTVHKDRKANVIISSEQNQRLLKQKPIILVNSECINDIA